jgi:membrane-associated phospholipid phosphatase
MSHGFGEVEAVQALLPDAVLVLFALLTQLGDTWWLFLVLVSVYLLADRTPLLGERLDREDGAFLFALALGAVALTLGLKTLFGHPRPPGAETAVASDAIPPLLRGLYASFATADGNSLPSGHALGSTVVYGGLALVLNVGTRRRRAAAAAALVAVVAASRVVIGVHYLGDVALGIGVGLVFLAVAYRLARDRPGRGLMLAVGLAILAAGAAGYAFEPLVALGAAIGARITWGSIGDGIPDRPANDREARLLAWVGVPFVLLLFGTTYALEAVVPGEFAAPAAGFLAAGVTLGVLLATPVLANDYVEGRLG